MRRSVCVAALLVAVHWPMALAAQTPPHPEGGSATWEYGGFADVADLIDAADPDNVSFRSRGTTWRLNATHLNMAGAYVRRVRPAKSGFGAELLVHAGKDSELFGFSATAPPLRGAGALRHVGLANVSYRSPAGAGLTVVGGIFPSLIGYDSLYAKDNAAYTRSWAADFTPYLMMGGSAAYAVTPALEITAFVINGYWHLAHANGVPSGGAQFAYRPTPRLTIKQTVLSGPHQSSIAFRFWRHLTDTVVEYRTTQLTAAFNIDFAKERIAEDARTTATWIAGQAVLNWRPVQRWSFTIRPEAAKDSHARWTLARQTVRALTTGTQYQVMRGGLGAAIRAEHRVDVSTGPDGGFFRDSTPSTPLKRTQHLLVAALILTFAGGPTRP